MTAMSIDPAKLRYTKSHEWAHLDGGVVTVGITQFAADQLTDVTYVELPKVGARLTPGKEFGNIETVKAVSDLYAPVEGEVTAVNVRLNDDPNFITREPYAGGWLIKVRVDNPNTALDHLLTLEQYQKQIESEAH
jgi:glycine cleavage system H protein